jgi:N-acylneuraminate cytidylyltransferase
VKNTVAFIFARGGSKGLPRKNILSFQGKPLLVHSIDIAKKLKGVKEIFVSTEDSEIAALAKEHGVNVINRPSSLAQDNSPELLSWKHAVSYVQERFSDFENFLSLPTTAPLRTKSDVEGCLALLDKKTDVVVTATESARSPFFNMVKIEKDGYASLLIEDEEIYYRRQDVPNSYDLTTLAYVAKPDFIISTDNLFSGRVKVFLVPKERSIDIDSHFDFVIAETIYKLRNK